MRKAKIERKTNETEVRIELDLDGKGKAETNTGLGFFDHMLTQIAVHGLFDLKIEAKGDLHIDPHHTVEDTGLALGMAFDQALGDRRGIVRMASFYTPMDETLGRIVIDLSGRPYSVIQVDWNAPSIGGIPSTLFEHFLESLAVSCRCNLHAQVLYGKDDHHKAEALFKALARALDLATQVEPRRASQIPSSKGKLV